MLTAVAGIAGVFSVSQIVPANYSVEFGYLHRIGMLFDLLVPVAFAVAVWILRSSGQTACGSDLAEMGAAFYLPVFVFSYAVSAVTGCATAHGLQYLVFMGSVSGSKQRSLRPVLFMVAIAAGGALLLDQVDVMASTQFGPALKGLAIGVVMSHFILDAGDLEAARSLPARLYAQEILLRVRSLSCCPNSPITGRSKRAH